MPYFSIFLSYGFWKWSCLIKGVQFCFNWYSQILEYNSVRQSHPDPNFHLAIVFASKSWPKVVVLIYFYTVEKKWLGGRIPSEAWAKLIVFFTKLLFSNPKMFFAICWHVKRHTKWHWGVNIHDPDSTSQQDRLHFQFYSLVYKRESFCRKWELIQIFTLKSKCSFIDQKGKKKKKGCIL